MRHRIQLNVLTSHRPKAMAGIVAIALALAVGACQPTASGGTGSDTSSPPVALATVFGGTPTASLDPGASAIASDAGPSSEPTSSAPGATPTPTPAPIVTKAPHPTPTKARTLICGLYPPPFVGPPAPVPTTYHKVIRVFIECDMDKDGNPGGALDANEGPIPGVVVTMRCTSPTWTESHTTGANGAATFYGSSSAGLTSDSCVMGATKAGWSMSAMFPNLALPPTWSGGVYDGVTYFDLFMAPAP